MSAKRTGTGWTCCTASRWSLPLPSAFIPAGQNVCENGSSENSLATVDGIPPACSSFRSVRIGKWCGIDRIINSRTIKRRIMRGLSPVMRRFRTFLQVAGSFASVFCKYRKGWSTFQCVHDFYRHLHFSHVLLRFRYGMPPDNPPSAAVRYPTPGTGFSLPAGYKTCAPHPGIPAMSGGRSSTIWPLPGLSGSVPRPIRGGSFRPIIQCGPMRAPAF